MSDMMPLVEMTSVCSDCRLPLHDLHDGRSVCPACRAVWPCRTLADGVSLILDGDEAVGYLPDDDETRRLACVQVSRQAEDYATQHQPTLPEHLKDADHLLTTAFQAGAVWQWKRDQLLKKYPVKTGRDMCGTESTANDEMVLRAAKALMESQTNFAHAPTRQDVDAVWDGLGDMARDGFLAQARHILERLGEE